MSKVLIAAGIVGWSAIALSMTSCSSNSNSTPAAKNTTENLAASPIDRIEQISPVENRSQSTPIVASSLAPADAHAVKAVAARSQNPIPVPYVNPLNSIVLVAQQQTSIPSASKYQPELKLASRSNPASQPNPSDNLGNVRLEQFDRISAQPKQYQTHHKSESISDCNAFPCLILSQDPSHPQNKFNNPIYKLTAYRDNKSNHIFQLNAVTGRGFTQTRNRYQSNTEAPLPDGSYSVSSRVVAGTIREVGGTMVPIFPKPGFNPRMRRTALGIHWDPSFDKDKKEDGTSGCIGLTNKNDYHRVRDFILKYRPRSIEVQITR
jgi:hypothetical protein